MTKKRRLEILENYRKSTGLFESEGAKKSFFNVYKDLSEEALLDIEKNIKNNSNC